MNGFVTFLLFAAFFYLMLRFGCGAHMMRGRGRQGGHGDPDARLGPDTAATKARDPVCGMEVEPGRGYAEMREGREYRFCSHKCLDRFDADPQRYAAAGELRGIEAESHAGCH